MGIAQYLLYSLFQFAFLLSPYRQGKTFFSLFRLSCAY